jgi:DNA-binding transcriptional MerR regulator
MADQDSQVFVTIGDLARELDLPQHILRYWESRFPMLKPMQRTGGRRYYRTKDADLARTINRLLNVEGYTIKGALQLLSGGGGSAAEGAAPGPAPKPMPNFEAAAPLSELMVIRDRLAAVLLEDAATG